ncbi:shematrin-like protein 1 [Ylistrum balloti]|uniref:shematrin-like protein 1 n=1 Tax=Ylistrum balloti TaxID=509963 RepID=UPI002905BCB7|nr:shematrin-like protein 1 [Ylistrum balloti]
MRFACAVLASLACLSVAVMGNGYGGSYYPVQNMYSGYGKGGMVAPYYGGYGGYGKGGGYGGYSGYGQGQGGYGFPTILYPVASPEPGDLPLAALGGLYGGGGAFGGNDNNIFFLLAAWYGKKGQPKEGYTSH